jgi:hypothetical protein
MLVAADVEKDKGQGCQFKPEQDEKNAESIFPEKKQADKGDEGIQEKETPVKSEQ